MFPLVASHWLLSHDLNLAMSAIVSLSHIRRPLVSVVHFRHPAEVLGDARRVAIDF
jgi:hypothetical protein